MLLAVPIDFTAQDSDAPPKAHLDGIVVDGVAGTPVADAVIRASGAGGDRKTDAEGGFSIDVNPGFQILSISKPGYRPARLDGRRLPGNTGIPVNLGPGERQSGLVIRLFPPAVVTGKAFDHRGQPMPGAEVQPFVYLYNDAGIRMRSDLPGSAKTNDLGEFRIENLDAGDYFFEFRPSFSDLGDGSLLAPVFFPGTTDPAAAQPVHLEPGFLTELSNISAIPVRGGVLRVTLSNQGDEPRGAAILSVFRKGVGHESFRSKLVQKDAMSGPVELGRLPPGAYFVRASFAGVNGGTNEGRAFIDLTENDTDLMIPIVKLQPWTVTGQAVLETMAGDTRPVSGLALAFYDAGLNAENEFMRLQPPTILTSQNGGSYPRRTLFPYSPPYFYRMQVLNPPRGTYVANIQGATSTHELHPAHGRETSLIVVLGENAGRITGTAVDGAGSPVSFGNVVLLPDNPEDLHRIVTAATAADGSFTLHAGPGAYHLHAWRELFGAPYLDPEFRARYEGQGQSVFVELGAQVTLNPRIFED